MTPSFLTRFAVPVLFLNGEIRFSIRKVNIIHARLHISRAPACWAGRNTIHFAVSLCSRLGDPNLIFGWKYEWSAKALCTQKNLHVFFRTHCKTALLHYRDLIMSAMASQIIGVTIVYPTNCSRAYQRNTKSASVAFVRGIHRSPVKSLHKSPATRNIFPFDDAIGNILFCTLYIP